MHRHTVKTAAPSGLRLVEPLIQGCCCATPLATFFRAFSASDLVLHFYMNPRLEMLLFSLHRTPARQNQKRRRAFA
jgi:hypothetical protein